MEGGEELSALDDKRLSEMAANTKAEPGYDGLSTLAAELLAARAELSALKARLEDAEKRAEALRKERDELRRRLVAVVEECATFAKERDAARREALLGMEKWAEQEKERYCEGFALIVLRDVEAECRRRAAAWEAKT